MTEVHTHTCPRCNAMFTPVRSTKTYCSQACQKLTWQKDRRRKDRINEKRRIRRNWQNKIKTAKQTIEGIDYRIWSIREDIASGYGSPGKERKEKELITSRKLVVEHLTRLERELS